MKFGKKLDNGQYFIKTGDLREVLKVKSIVLGRYGIFVEY